MLPLLRSGNDPRIVNVASMSGYLKKLKSKDLQERCSSPSLTTPELSGLIDDFEASVHNGSHDHKGRGNCNPHNNSSSSCGNLTRAQTTPHLQWLFRHQIF
jgi:hypothetical protein